MYFTEQFSDYVSEQILRIRSELMQNVNSANISTDGETQPCLLTAFEPATENEIRERFEVTKT